MKKHYETHVEDTDKLISVAGPVLDYKSWYEQYRKLMEEQAQRKYGLYTPTSEGDDDDFPSISGIIARYSALGLTNEQMAANPVWVDKTGNGHDLQMKNFAWSGMSGVGGYETNAEIYEFSPTSTNKIVADRVKHISYTFEVKGMVSGNDLSLRDGINTIYYSWEKDGIYTVDVDVLDPAGTLRLYNGYSHQKGTFTVRIFPSYPGAIVFDGVDDCGVCDNFPILTKEKGYTVVALRSYLAESIGYLVYNGTNAKQSAFAFERSDSFDTWSWGINSSIRNSLPKLMSYQTSNSYNNNIISTGTAIEGDKLIRIVSSGGYCNVAIWELVFLDHDATEEELTKIKDYFVKTYPWLFPDQAWTVTGKTNEDEDRATIANITGNGNDLVLSNFGFAEGSGYGLYKTPFELYPSVQHSSKYSLSFSKFALGDHNLIIAPKQNDLSYDIKVKVTGLKDGVKFKWGWIGTTGYIDITTDGIHMLNKPASQIRQLIVEFAEDFDPDHVVTIEQIPEYEGYLVTDGVDDEVRSAAFTLNEDWTIVGDWELLSNVQINCGIVKAQNVYLYNTANGLLISINNPSSLQSFGTKSLHAICSDGRLYDRNWVEYEYTADQNFAIVESSLNIGFNLNNYTQMAFKNLGIYNNQLLSKDDCIKAYNYLQTLKSK